MDKVFMQLDNMARDIMRATATLHLAFMEDHRLDIHSLPTLEEQMEQIFALTASLSKALENLRLKAVDPRLLPMSDEVLVDKDGLKLLEAQQRVARTLKGCCGPCGKSKGKGKGRGYHPYHSSPSQWHGRGKGKGQGKGGKSYGNKPKFTFGKQQSEDQGQ